MNILDIHKRVLIENEALKIQHEAIKLEQLLKDTHGKTERRKISAEILRLNIKAMMKFENAARIG